MFLYKIVNKINNKIYIGQTINLKSRTYSHFNKSNNSILSKAIQKYGKENFKVEIIARALSMDELNHRESYYIKLFKCLTPMGYNLRTGGSNSRLSQETKEKLRLANVGRKASLETRRKMSQSHKNIPRMGITIQQLAQRQLKEQERRKLKFKPKKIQGWVNPQIGKIVSSESRIKNAIAHGAKSFLMKDNKGQILWNGLILSECAKQFNLSVGNISECLRGKRKHHKGYFFTFEVMSA